MPNNQVCLKQARAGIKQLILESPETITIKRKALIDDGAGDGVMVPDPFGTPDEVSLTVRISPKQKGPEIYDSVQAGLSTNLSRFILVDWESLIYAEDIFYTIERWWKIGPVDTLKKFGGVIGYQAALSEAEDLNESS